MPDNLDFYNSQNKKQLYAEFESLLIKTNSINKVKYSEIKGVKLSFPLGTQHVLKIEKIKNK